MAVTKASGWLPVSGSGVGFRWPADSVSQPGPSTAACSYSPIQGTNDHSVRCDTEIDGASPPRCIPESGCQVPCKCLTELLPAGVELCDAVVLEGPHDVVVVDTDRRQIGERLIGRVVG